MVEKLTNEVLTNEDCLKCPKKCCVYLFTNEDGPKLQSYEVHGVLNAVLNARKEIVNEKTKEKFELLIRHIVIGGTIIPLPVVIDGSPENVCGVYSLERERCLIYNNRPESCKIYPAHVDKYRVVWVDTGCLAYEKVCCYLRNHGIDAQLSDFSKENLEIRRKERNY